MAAQDKQNPFYLGWYLRQGRMIAHIRKRREAIKQALAWQTTEALNGRR